MVNRTLDVGVLIRHCCPKIQNHQQYVVNCSVDGYFSEQINIIQYKHIQKCLYHNVIWYNILQSYLLLVLFSLLFISFAS